ncbi:MAG: TMEM43 family protein [Cyclobacteriaceae bacterium]|nr:TMEM43 family protein [Cyclobacteriaceae bacterium]
MTDFTEVTSEGWGSRIMNSIKGVLFGIALFLGAFVVLWWNEGRAIKTERGLDEGASLVATIDVDKIEQTNDGKLVHLIGPVETESIFKDEMFNIELNALKLNRIVEMYQWVETKEESTKKKVGGGTETTTTYGYVKSWNGSLIDSDNFKVPEEHTNPKNFAYNSYGRATDVATIGVFTLSNSLLYDISNYQPLPVSNVDTLKVKNSQIMESGIVYIGEGSPTHSKIGDIKLKFKVIKPGQYSIVAKQVDNTFEPFGTSEGTTISMISSGTVSSENMFQAAQNENTIITWILRLVGFFMMFIGLVMIFNPLVVLADVLPFLGSLLGMGLSLMAGVISFMLSFITIAIAWIKFRPVLGIGLLIAGIGVFILFYITAGKKKNLKTDSSSSEIED